MPRILFFILFVVVGELGGLMGSTAWATNLTIDCKKTKNNVDQMICNNPPLKLQEDKFQQRYKTLFANLNAKQQQGLNQQVNELVIARNECLNLYGISSAALTTQSTTNPQADSMTAEAIPFNAYQQGCVLTWYASITSVLQLSIQHPTLFQIPSRAQYTEAFKQLVSPLPFLLLNKEIPNPEAYKMCKDTLTNQADQSCENSRVDVEDKELTYIIYFPIQFPFFAQAHESKYNYPAGAAHGTTNWKKTFTSLPNKPLDSIEGGSYTCSVPITEPIILQDKIYLPQTASFTQETKQQLGTYDTSNCYACSGVYEPDCLLKLTPMNKTSSKETDKEYWVFTSHFWNTKTYFTQQNQQRKNYSTECVQAVITRLKKNNTPLNKELSTQCEKGERDNQNACFLIETTEFPQIIEQIQQECNPAPGHSK
jgi:uncharacterized protein